MFSTNAYNSRPQPALPETASKRQRDSRAVRKEIQQLRKELANKRTRVSVSAKGLVEYCEEHRVNDALLTGSFQGGNPYKSGKAFGTIPCWAIPLCCCCLPCLFIYAKVSSK